MYRGFDADKGMTLIRANMAIAVGKAAGAAEYVRDRWNNDDRLQIYTAKAAVGGFTVQATDTDFTPEELEFFDAVVAKTAFGKISGWREMDFNVRTLQLVNGATGYWVSESAPKPISKPTVQGSILRPLKSAAIVVFPRESVRLGGDKTEQGIKRDMIKAIQIVMDTSLLDPNNTGTANKEPASITASAPTISSSGSGADNFVTDLESLFNAFGGDLATAYFATDSFTAAKIGLLKTSGSGFLFPDVGPRGGNLQGIPLVTTDGSPVDSNASQLALIDPSGIAVALEGARVAQSEVTSIAMADDVTGAQEMVSLFQTNSVAFLVEIFGNWQTQRSGSVALMNVTF